jgi:hypothetical protein
MCIALFSTTINIINRPISLTSICSEVLEHIVGSSISEFLDDSKIPPPGQHGFRSGHSCETQLVFSGASFPILVGAGIANGKTGGGVFENCN